MVTLTCLCRQSKLNDWNLKEWLRHVDDTYLSSDTERLLYFYEFIVSASNRVRVIFNWIVNFCHLTFDETCSSFGRSKQLLSCVWRKKMAAKGRKAQLQSEIKTSQDLTLFLDQYPGNLFCWVESVWSVFDSNEWHEFVSLLFFLFHSNVVLDIYTECYGPCKPMVPSLRKIKAGTDVLQMAVVSHCRDVMLTRLPSNSNSNAGGLWRHWGVEKVQESKWTFLAVRSRKWQIVFSLDRILKFPFPEWSRNQFIFRMQHSSPGSATAKWIELFAKHRRECSAQNIRIESNDRNRSGDQQNHENGFDSEETGRSRCN